MSVAAVLAAVTDAPAVFSYGFMHLRERWALGYQQLIDEETKSWDLEDEGAYRK